jgi:hypothetical protein
VRWRLLHILGRLPLLEVVAVDREKVRAEFFKIYPAENAKAKRESL